MMVKSCFVPNVCSLLHLSTKRVFCHEPQWATARVVMCKSSWRALRVIRLSYQNHSGVISRARAEIIQFQPVTKTRCQADTGFAEDFMRFQ